MLVVLNIRRGFTGSWGKRIDMNRIDIYFYSTPLFTNKIRGTVSIPSTKYSPCSTESFDSTHDFKMVSVMLTFTLIGKVMADMIYLVAIATVGMHVTPRNGLFACRKSIPLLTLLLTLF